MGQIPWSKQSLWPLILQEESQLTTFKNAYNGGDRCWTLIMVRELDKSRELYHRWLEQSKETLQKWGNSYGWQMAGRLLG